MVTVSDYGKGIPDSMKKELFKRFYSKAEGSGLGLSIVRTLVERYKGKIWIGDRVYEDYAQGAEFGMIFPAAQEQQ
jgi:two-component system sensor histidine kinase FlrB